MKMALLVGFIALFSLGAMESRAACDSIELPDGVAILHKQLGIIRHSYNEIRSADRARGRITIKTTFMSHGYSLTGSQDGLVASTELETLEVGSAAQVFDCGNNLVGSFEVKRVGTFNNKVTIIVRDRDGNTLVTADSVSLSDDTIVFKKPSGSTVFSIEVVRNLIAENSWKLRIADASSIDTRLALFLLHFRAS